MPFPFHFISCSAQIPISYFFISCMRFLRVPGLNKLLTFQIAICITLLHFKGRFLMTVRLISLGFSTGNSFTDAELSILQSNPQLGGPGTLLSGLPYLSREHPILRHRVLALTHPHGVGFAGSTGNYQLRHFLGFNGYTYSTSNQSPRPHYQPFTLLLSGLETGMKSIYFIEAGLLNSLNNINTVYRYNFVSVSSILTNGVLIISSWNIKFV